MKRDDRKLSQIQITLFPSKLPAIKRKKWDLNYIIYQKQINVWLHYSIAQLYNLVNGSGLEPIANKSFQICCLKVQREALSYRKKPCVSNFQNQKIIIILLKLQIRFNKQQSFVNIFQHIMCQMVVQVVQPKPTAYTVVLGLITHCNFKLSILINFYFHKQNNVKYVRKPVSQHSLQLFSILLFLFFFCVVLCVLVFFYQISNIHKVTLFDSQRTKCALTLFYNVLSPPVLGQCNIVKGGVSGCRLLTSFVSILSLKEEVVFVL
ncbi:Hypothetical_protein [Hexamita inflata]|uniref:Hypothetical_protein n=1 Tax=Hexamita inflata TaxID=28002 RepID=A0AA86PB42_9EUKA|nr:Hypothetical protein HINF_LOCUS21773 [Hexamita inflata]